MRSKYLPTLVFLTAFVIGAINPGAGVAANIYYSVGQNTSDHKTGSPTVTVSGTTMTFSTPQIAPNMGVGDVVSYGGNTCYINGRTSSTVWSCVTATGGTPAAATDAPVDSIRHAFGSLNAAVHGATPGVADANHLNTTDLVAGDYNLFIPCYYDTGPDTTGTRITALTTDSAHGIKIYTPYLSSEVNQSQRHQGTWTTNAYRIELPIDSCLEAILTTVQNVWVEGLQIKIQDSSCQNIAGISFEQSAGLGQASKNIIWGSFSTSSNSNYGIYVLYQFTHGITTTKIWDNIIYGIRQGANVNYHGIFVTEGTQGYIYNNTIYGNYKGITSHQWGESGESILIKNNLCNGNDVDYYAPGGVGAFDDASVNNISEDITSPNTSFRSRTATFVSTTPGSEDFHLAASDTAARGEGVNLSSDPFLAFSDDIDGQTRSSEGAWDIGVDTYVLRTLTVNVVGSGSVTKNPDKVAYDDGESVELTAEPAVGWSFSVWSGDLTGSANPDSITMDADRSVTASFAINTYTLTYTAGANGSISGTSPQTVNHGASGTAVTAVPATGYHFVQWSDASTANPRTDTNVTANITVTASFAINTYTLTYTAGAHGSISGISPQTVSHGASGTAVTAVPDTGYHFVQWSDASTANPRTDTNVVADITVTASFAIFAINMYDDFNGDGKTDIAVYHSASGFWFIKPSTGAADYYVGYGGIDYVPVPGDYDGDGKTDIAVYHSATGLWFIKPSTGAADYYVGYGGTGYAPVNLDYLHGYVY